MEWAAEGTAAGAAAEGAEGAEGAVSGRGGSCRRDLPWAHSPGSRLRSSVRSWAWHSWRGSCRDLGRAPTRQSNTELLATTFTFAGTAALPLLFPGPGYFPFGFGDLVVTLAICALMACPPVVSSRPVRVGAVLYAAVSIGIFLVRTPVGDNDTRLAAYIGVPLAICYLPGAAHRLALGPEPGGRMPRWTATVLPAAVAVSLVAWHWSPGLEALDAATNGPSSTAAYYEPLIAELASLSRHRPVRVEIPPTAHHWESAYVAPKFDLARGWERQLDIAYDPLFYQAGPLTPSEYRTWLLANGVSFVALADAPLDYAATAEARLLRSGEVKGLQAVWHTASWQLWRVIGSRGARNCPRYRRLAEPSLGGRSLLHPGVSTLRLRWSPFWSLAGPRRSRSVPAPGGGWLDRARFLGCRAAPAQHVASRRRPWQLSRPGRRTIGPERPMTDA